MIIIVRSWRNPVIGNWHVTKESLSSKMHLSTEWKPLRAKNSRIYTFARCSACTRHVYKNSITKKRPARFEPVEDNGAHHIYIYYIFELKRWRRDSNKSVGRLSNKSSSSSFNDSQEIFVRFRRPRARIDRLKV